MVPVVVTNNLILRGAKASDFDAYAAFWAGPRAEPFGGPFSRDDAWDSFLSDAGHWAIRGFGHWTVALKADDTPIGWAGFVQAHDAAEPEIGCAVYDAYEGTGLAHEAIAAARAYGAQHLGIPRPLGHVAAWNARSVALAQRLGAEELKGTTRADGPYRVFRMPAPEGLQ